MECESGANESAQTIALQNMYEFVTVVSSKLFVFDAVEGARERGRD